MRGRQGILGLVPLSLFLSAVADSQNPPDFGPDGLAGLSQVKIWRLNRGEIILPESLAQTADGRTLIEAALVFDRPREDVWRLLSRTEDQVKYLGEVKKVTVLSKSPTDDWLEFTTKVLIKTFVYRQRHHFEAEDFYFWWELDPSFPSEIKELSGFWRFYPFGQGRTLGRYGTRVLVGLGIPKSIQTSLTKNQLPDALRSVKRYVDSGGIWEKNQSRKAAGSSS
jgi:hypothetical protein